VAEVPQVHPEILRKIVDDPDLCDPHSKIFRDKLPAHFRDVLETSHYEKINGLYFKHQLMVGRLFIWCCVCVGTTFAIAVYVGRAVDTATGFTVGAFLLAVPSPFLAILAVVVALRRR